MIRIQKAAHIAPKITAILDQIPLVDFMNSLSDHYRDKLEMILAQMVRRLRGKSKFNTTINHEDRAFSLNGKDYHRTIIEDAVSHNQDAELQASSLQIDVWERQNYKNNSPSERQTVYFSVKQRNGAVEIRWSINHIIQGVGEMPEIVLASYAGRRLGDIADTDFSRDPAIGGMTITGYEQTKPGSIAALHRLTLVLREIS